MTSKYFFTQPWYIFLLSVFFVLHGFTENFFLVPVKDAFLLLLVYLGVSVILVSLFWVLYRNIQKAVFLSFLLLSFNFFFGYVHDGIKLLFPGSFATKYLFVLSGAFVAFVMATILIKRKNRFFPKLTLYLNLLFGIFIIIDAGGLIKKIFSYKSETEIVLSGKSILPCIKNNLPDVYLIIADEYAGRKDLADICGFDNNPFLDSLRQRGFFVADNSRSNYNYTTYSTASILNMGYLPLNQKQINKADHLYALKLILKNKVTSFFGRAGYKIHNYSAFDIGTQHAQNTNSFIPSRTTLLTSQTLISRLKKDVWLNAARMLGLRKILINSLYENLRYNQQVYQHAMDNIRLADTSSEFVYLHLQLPHYPYYYDKDGNPYPLEKVIKDSPGNTKNYIQYVQYSNRTLLTLIDEILKHQGTPPVIILMSDHGYRSYPAKFNSSYVFLNLLSVYLPDKNYSEFSDSLTNVNVFRMVLNAAFCQDIPLLKDTTILVQN